MNKTRNAAMAAFSLLMFAVTTGLCGPTNSVPQANPDLEKALRKCNAWRAAHTNSIVKFNVGGGSVTSYYLGDSFKMVVETPSLNNNRFVEFLSTNGDVLVYLPSTGVTVKDPDTFNAYVYKELLFSRELTEAKVKYFGGKLEYRRKDNRDCLVISIPANPFPKTEPKQPVYSATQELQMDDEGKVVRQIVTARGISTPVDFEYVTFDPIAVKTASDAVVIKPTIDAGVDLRAAAKAEDAKNSSKFSYRKKIILAVLVLIALIPIYLFKWAKRDVVPAS